MAMTKLKLYNGALFYIGEDSLSTLTDNVETRRLLDSVYDRGGINYILEQGLWNFAMRSAKLEYSPSVTPAFGHTYAFEKPTDLVRVSAISSDEYLASPLLRYLDEGNYWFSDLDEIYVQYVSNDASYGTDYSLWPETFSRFAEAWFGSQIYRRTSQNRGGIEDLNRDVHKLLVDARSKDAMKEPTKFLPSGRWTGSRGGGNSERGVRGSLIG